MNIDLELYKVFYIVAKNKHMTKASEELHISQPAISQSIKKLEDQLGGTLFLRSNKGMELTEEGKMFCEYVKGALELINDAENEFTSFKDLTKGEIKIGCSTTLTKLILMNALKEFHKEYPNININITNNLTSNLINDLKLGKLDFVIFNESNIKEKIIKNAGKDSVIVIAITQDKEYIITIQNRINDKLIAEFPSGYIENNEDPIEAAKRELKEETGYISDDLFLVDEAYTSPGTDNSKTYIVIANNCIKTNEKNITGTELIDYGLFSEKELEYLINKNIINGAMNKLAYYNLINNVDDCNITYANSNKKIYKKSREKRIH